jgi:hypothetical protein
MMKISEVACRELNWTQKSDPDKPDELKCEGNTVATLRFLHAFSSSATAESGDGIMKFDTKGFFKIRGAIKNSATGNEIAKLRISQWTLVGTLELPDGRKFRSYTNSHQKKAYIKNENEEILVCVTNRGYLRPTATFEILPSATSMPELPLLVVFAFYLKLIFVRWSRISA